MQISIALRRLPTRPSVKGRALNLELADKHGNRCELCNDDLNGYSNGMDSDLRNAIRLRMRLANSASLVEPTLRFVVRMRGSESQLRETRVSSRLRTSARRCRRILRLPLRLFARGRRAFARRRSSERSRRSRAAVRFARWRGRRFPGASRRRSAGLSARPSTSGARRRFARAAHLNSARTRERFANRRATSCARTFCCCCTCCSPIR